MAASAAESPKTLLGAILKRITHAFVFLAIALLLAVAIEWIGMTFFWPEEGVFHSRRMVESEYSALNLAIKEDAVAGLWVADLAASFVHGGYALLAQKSRVEWVATKVSGWTGSLMVVGYAEATLNSIQAFLLRLVVVVLALPAFLLVAVMSAVEGLSRRALRRYGGGHETAYVFHHAKRAVAPSVILPAVIYLSWPAPLSPLAVFGPALVVFAIAVTLTVSKFKKFL